MIGLRLGVALFGLTVFSSLVLYYSLEEKRNKEKISKDASSILVSSVGLGSSPSQAETQDHIAGTGHEDGGGDDFCD